MAKLLDILKKLTFRKQPEELSASDVERLRADFKARYHSFKLLLSANNKALEIMAEMEQALGGNRPFGMSFVRSHCTAVSVNVYRIVQYLDQLAPEKYTDLYDSFKQTRDQINRILSQRKETKGDRLVVSFNDVNKDLADQVGGKMANVGEVRNQLHLRVPDGFVVTSLAYRRFFEHNDLQAEIDRLLQASSMEQIDELYGLSADIQQRIIRADIPGDLKQAIREAYGELESREGKGVKVSMRSSALGEDTEGASFAGQYRSELNVSSDNLFQAYKDIVASKYNLQAITYRLNRGILDEDIAMCVGCMVMVQAVAGGVIYSRNPLNIRDDSVTLNSVWGLPKSVVDGSVATDLFVVSRSSPLSISKRDVKNKEHRFVCYPEEGVCRMEVTGEKSGQPSLRDDQILELARTAVEIENYYGAPQDIEWAVDEEGAVYILQSRPLRQGVEQTGARRAGEEEIGAKAVLLRGGATASPGVAYGPVFVVRKNSDTLLFPDNAVMVASQALPRWAALLSRAAAVVTEQGSVAGHLANVARELRVPALFGVAGAAEALSNGMEVTVDADGMRIYDGRVEELMGSVPVRKNLMEGSPVYDILQQVSRHIIPLHLLDPDSSDFKPASCRSLHDITRFCHEKSVKEMFNFGKEHHFSERASKQLFYNVPMQWWFINLDDGFKEDVPGKFVLLDNIVCIPMLALWEGIIAVPWQGPPPVDARGFMSVLLEATTNPALDPSMPSHYTNRNYFMVSKNFCSLNSRFGFHFCTLETLVGDRPGENYISFSFKGGAADFQRRLRRAEFVAAILEEHGFRVEVKEDGVFARMEGYDEEIMKERLKILGYLIMHTRQLDMVMSNDSAYQEHKTKLLNDIATVVCPRGPVRINAHAG